MPELEEQPLELPDHLTLSSVRDELDRRPAGPRLDDARVLLRDELALLPMARSSAVPASRIALPRLRARKRWRSACTTSHSAAVSYLTTRFAPPDRAVTGALVDPVVTQFMVLLKGERCVRPRCRTETCWAAAAVRCRGSGRR